MTKPCKAKIAHLAAKILYVEAIIARIAAKSGIWQKFACLKVVLSFFEKFLKFFGIFNGENTLFTKSDKKCSSFRKNYFIFFHNRGGGGGSGPLMEFSRIFFIFFEPFPNLYIFSNKCGKYKKKLLNCFYLKFHHFMDFENFFFKIKIWTIINPIKGKSS